MDFTTNELETVINELEAVKSREKDPGTRSCLTIAQMILQEKMKQNMNAQVKEAFKGVVNND